MTATARRNAFDQPIGEALLGWTPRPLPTRTPHEGRFCRLEPLDIERHADALYVAYAQAPDARDWTYLPEERELDRCAFRTMIAARVASLDPLHMAVICDGRALGLAALMRIDSGNGTIELGHIHFAPTLQRTPAATEALFLLMRHAIAELGYRRLEWKCDSRNEPSRRAAARLGFVFEGIFRNAVITKGRNRDTSWHSITMDEWPPVRAGLERWLAPGNFDGEGQQIASLSAIRAGGA